MAYCTQSDLETRIGTTRLAEIANDVAGSAAANSTIVTAMIARADRFIDSYAGQIYTVPFVTPTNCTAIPSQITQLSIDLAIYYCFSRRPAQLDVPKQWVDIYNDACKKLEAIANRMVSLDGSPTVLTNQGLVQNDINQVVDLGDTDGAFSNF